jgi:hypothetical protein
MVTSEAPNIRSDIEAELLNTKKFLESKSCFTKQKIESLLDSKVIFRWCLQRLVSGYFLAISPIVQEWIDSKGINLVENFAIDLEIYKNKLTDEVRSFFAKEFTLD